MRPGLTPPERWRVGVVVGLDAPPPVAKADGGEGGIVNIPTSTLVPPPRRPAHPAQATTPTSISRRLIPT